jgi:hypothetical protein
MTAAGPHTPTRPTHAAIAGAWPPGTRELLLAALAYAVAGWPVLPVHTPTPAGGCSCGRPRCASAGKHPRTRRGLRDASTDPAVIAGWWSRWPDANVAVRTGTIVVLDVDGDHGARAVRALEHRHGPLPPTRRARTARGEHVYLEPADHQIACSAGQLGPGLDVRGRGGYVLAPPSRHASGSHYTWTDTRDPAPIPTWLAELAQRPERTLVRAPLPPSVADASGDRAGRYWRAALEGELAAVASARKDTRNTTLNRCAFRLGQLLGAGLGDPDCAVNSLLDAALHIGLREREARATIASGLRAGQAQPRRVHTRD